ncbi:MAG: serine/threonine-protein kinase [bacterium]|nr:serine/threonine-protein kinase [bacterium]
MIPGERVAHYEIIGPIGRGGMGEVYLARDTRLDREVALKVLPADLQADPERLARFRREAKVLASLNHTNIAAIHGLEQDGERLVLAMELAPGETLEARLARGAMPAEALLDVALQVAAGLEEAHQKGVVHRDLKPANVKLGPEGQVKILDFGLARAFAGEESANGDPDLSPTLTAAMTGAGVILGTAAYMSPEQARGHGIDARTDIWAFGVILWELLAGRRLFAGETVSDTLAMVLRADPEWDALPPDLPPSLVGLVKRCLQRDRRQRLHHIADARIVLEEIRRDGTSAHMGTSGAGQGASDALAGAGSGPRGRRARLFLGSGWLVAVGLAAALAWQAMSDGTPPPPRPVRFDLQLPAGKWIANQRQSVAVSPAGDVIALSLNDSTGRRLYVRDLADPVLRPIAGTEGGATPFFAPDGRNLAFTQAGRLKKVALDGGSPTDLCASEWGGGTWLDDGRIVLTRSYAGGLDVVDAGGGPVQPLTEPDPASGELGHWWPQVLPGGEWIVYTSWNTPIEKARIMACSLKSGAQRVLVEGGAFGRWLPTGHLTWVRDRKLLAAPFDLGALRVTGTPEPLLEDIFLNAADGYSNLAVGSDGTLVYAPASVMEYPVELVWADREGRVTATGLPAGRYASPRLSPDGRTLAVALTEQGNTDIWLHDLQRGTRTRFTFSPTTDFNPVWSFDGRTLYYNGEEPQYTIYARPADGSADTKLLLEEPVDTIPTSVSPDGRLLVFTRSDPGSDSDLWLLPLDGSGPARPFLKTDFTEAKGVVSPDGRWLAYISNESGREEVYAMPFPDGGTRVQVSIDGGDEPHWSARGGEIIFRAAGAFYAVAIDAGAARAADLVAGRPRRLFASPFADEWTGAAYSVTDDGQRLLAVRVPPASMPSTLRVVLHWFGQVGEPGFPRR